MTPPAIQFWFEFASTYSHVAAFRIEQLASQAGVAIQWKPFLLGPILAAQGWNDSPFKIYPAKGRYMWRDIERLCAKYEIPFRRPSQFPRSGLLAARIACTTATGDWCPAFVKAVYRANFAEDRDISNPGVIASLLAALALPAKELIEQAGSTEAKTRLREQNDEAVRLGIFGAPTFVSGGELFWGSDRLEDSLAALTP